MAHHKTHREVADGPPEPVSLTHPCHCQRADMPAVHTLGDHPVGDPKRPRPLRSRK